MGEGSWRSSVIAWSIGALVMTACAVDEAGEPRTRGDQAEEEEKERDDSRRADAGSKGSDGGRKDASRSSASGRDTDRETDDPEVDEDDESKDQTDEPEQSGGEEDDEPGEEPGKDAEDTDDTDAEAPPDDGEEPAEEGPRGEVIMPEGGEPIYVDPSCPNMMPMFGQRSIELVGCCLKETMKCGLSTHKLMIPAQFASMFPTKCRGYEDLAMFMLTPPDEEKACTVP